MFVSHHQFASLLFGAASPNWPCWRTKVEFNKPDLTVKLSLPVQAAMVLREKEQERLQAELRDAQSQINELMRNSTTDENTAATTGQFRSPANSMSHSVVNSRPNSYVSMTSSTSEDPELAAANTELVTVMLQSESIVPTTEQPAGDLSNNSTLPADSDLQSSSATMTEMQPSVNVANVDNRVVSPEGIHLVTEDKTTLSDSENGDAAVASDANDIFEDAEDVSAPEGENDSDNVERQTAADNDRSPSPQTATSTQSLQADTDNTTPDNGAE